MSMMKVGFAFAATAVVALAIAGWPRAQLDRALVAPAVAAQAPTPTVSVTTLPAMPGQPSSSPATEMPFVTPAPTIAPTPALGGPTPPPVGYATIPVVGQVLHPVDLTLSQLQHMKELSLTLHFHVYTGVPLTEILALTGLAFPDDPQTLMRKYVYFQGIDGKNAILSFPEFTKQFNGQLILLAYSVDLHDVKPPGFAELVVQGDKTNTRFIKVARIIVGEPPAPQ